MPESATEDLRLLPGGRLLLAESAAWSTTETRAAFRKSNATGLLALQLEEITELPPAAAFWRGFAERFLGELCYQLPESATDLEVLPIEELKRVTTAAPLTSGTEYLTAELLAEIWKELGETVATGVRDEGGELNTWLQKHTPLSRLIGSLTFHLAENRASAEYPFAFLATWVQQTASSDRLRHMPLGQAIRRSAREEDQELLHRLLEPIHRAASANGFVRELVETKQIYRAIPWTPQDAWRFLQAAQHLREAGIVVKLPDWWKGGRPPQPMVQVDVDAAEGGKQATVGLHSLLRFNVALALDGEPLTAEEMKKLLESAGNLVSIRGRWVELDRERLLKAQDLWQKAARASASAGVPFLEGLRMIAGMRRGALQVDGVSIPPEFLDVTEARAAGQLRDLINDLRDPGRLPEINLGPELKAELRPYQQRGVNWLWQLVSSGFGACLADDMGLGKTIQVIALLLHQKAVDEEADLPPSLLIVPASLLGNWESEIERFAPSLSVFMAHPTFQPEGLKKLPRVAMYDLVITTYGMVSRLPGLPETAWNFVVLDEAQAIKNADSTRSQEVRKLHSLARITLTGTPVENRVEDLWSLFEFLNPGLLGPAAEFRARVREMQKSGFDPLRKLIAPYVLRRLKTDRSVISDLPDKVEVRARCRLTRPQVALYQKTVQQLAIDLKNPAMPEIQRKGLVLSNLMRLKQICNHPAMWTGSGNYEPENSGKFQRLAEICEEIAARGEKVIVFSQFREMAAPLSEHLSTVFRRPGLVLHGGTPVAERQELVAQFQDAAGPPFFVISLKAGGSGLNLTAATHVIHFDRWWNPAIEDQATDRAYRIGQHRNVLVHKFVCLGTVEEKIDRLIEDKRALAAEIAGDASSVLLMEMNDEELLDFVTGSFDS